MGKAVLTYRCAIEGGLKRLRSMLVLPSRFDEVAFEELAEVCRENNARAGSNACNPVLFEPMVMSVLLGQQK